MDFFHIISEHVVLHSTLEYNWTLFCNCLCSSGSEAGTEDALVGNVSKLMVSPPGYTGVPRKGHLVFDACFESGEYYSKENVIVQ